MRLTAHTVHAPFSAHGSPVDDRYSGPGCRTSRALHPFNSHLPVPLPPVLGITPSGRVLWGLRRPEPLGFEAIPH